MSNMLLTEEQKKFATEHHGLVYKFLNTNYLPEDEYYDIVVFGYLKAVHDYLTRPSLQKFSFATIGWKGMMNSLSNHYKKQNRQKRKADVISLNVSRYDDGPALEDTISEMHPLMQRLEAQLLLHDLAGLVSKQQMDMVRLKSSGFGVREIARNQNISMKRVQELLEDARKILTKLCYE